MEKLLLSWGLVKGADKVISRKAKEENGCCSLFISVSEICRDFIPRIVADQEKRLLNFRRDLGVRSCSSSFIPCLWELGSPHRQLSHSHSLLITKLFCTEEGWAEAFNVNEERWSRRGQTCQAGDCVQHLPPEIPATAFHFRYDGEVWNNLLCSYLYFVLG